MRALFTLATAVAAALALAPAASATTSSVSYDANGAGTLKITGGSYTFNQALTYADVFDVVEVTRSTKYEIRTIAPNIWRTQAGGKATAGTNCSKTRTYVITCINKQRGIGNIEMTVGDGPDDIVNHTTLPTTTDLGPGRDLYYGGKDFDIVHGGDGNDWFGDLGDRPGPGTGTVYGFHNLYYGDAGDDQFGLKRRDGALGGEHWFLGTTNDYLVGGPGKDVYYPMAGDDYVAANDGQRDGIIDCDVGNDTAVIDAGLDDTPLGCEH